MANYIALALTTVIAVLGIWSNNRSKNGNGLKRFGTTLILLTIGCSAATAIGIRSSLNDQRLVTAGLQAANERLADLRDHVHGADSVEPPEIASQVEPPAIAVTPPTSDSPGNGDTPAVSVNSSPESAKAAAKRAYDLLNSSDGKDRVLGERALRELPDFEEYLRLVAPDH